MKVAIYLRVSTSEQSCDAQRKALEAHCKRNDLTIVKVYQDDGITGTTSDRPALKQMQSDAARCPKPFDALVCYKIDRLARSVADLLSIVTHITSCGVGLVVVTQQIDTTTPYGKMVVTFLGAVAEFESELIKERVVSGVRAAQARGVHCGRPRSGFDVAKAVQLKNRGWGVRRIAKAVGVSHTTVHRTLQALQAA